VAVNLALSRQLSVMTYDCRRQQKCRLSTAQG
jgi:hypothetical protein